MAARGGRFAEAVQQGRSIRQERIRTDPGASKQARTGRIETVTLKAPSAPLPLRSRYADAPSASDTSFSPMTQPISTTSSAIFATEATSAPVAIA